MSREQTPKSAFTNDTTIYTIMGVSALLLFGVGYNIVSGNSDNGKKSKEEHVDKDTQSDDDLDTDSDESEEDTE